MQDTNDSFLLQNARARWYAALDWSVTLARNDSGVLLCLLLVVLYLPHDIDHRVVSLLQLDTAAYGHRHQHL